MNGPMLDLIAISLNCVVLAVTMRTKAEIAELKVYMHEHFEPKRKP